MKKRIFLLICFLLFHAISFSQIIESDRLLEQSFDKVFSEPDEVLKVAQHFKKTKDSNQKANAFLLSALAHYSKGAYDQSLINAFEAKNIASENQNDEVYAKSVSLISNLFEILKLNEAKEYAQLITKEDFAKYSLIHKTDKNSLKTQGEVLFNEKKYDSAVSVLEKAISESEKIKNPFLQLEIHQLLATNYLALGNQEKYRIHYQKSLALINQTEQIENEALSKAHQLITQELDDDLSNKKNSFNTYFLIALLATIVLIILIISTYFFSRNRIKTYQSLLSFLENSKSNSTNKSPEIPKTERKQVVLKESEISILEGLEQFEESHGFIDKDMSLGMLASQLGTNTKYLSEVINRNKGKNFKAYINEQRIRYIVEKIKNEPNYANYKVSYLAEACGFTLHSTFTSVFKSVVGVSPITFIEILKEEQKKK